MKARTLLESFRFAFLGGFHALRTERNLRIHLVAAVVVLVLAFAVGVPPADFALLLLAIGLVVTAELLNTALEAAVDLWSPDYHPAAAVAKNVAAAAVLTSAIVSAAVGYIVFRDHLSSLPAALAGAGLVVAPRSHPRFARSKEVDRRDVHRCGQVAARSPGGAAAGLRAALGF